MKDVILTNFSCSYGDKRIFDDLNLRFDGGKINVILGGSGVGKTTLLNAIAGLKSYSGSIEGNDEGIGYIFQKDRLIPTISVYKNLDLILKRVYKDRKERKQRILDMAVSLEIEDVLKSLPTQISGGQAQRVSMARAFLYPCDFLLLDEPFKALDNALKERLIKKFVELCKVSGKTVLFVTHSLDECNLTNGKRFCFEKDEEGIARLALVE